MQLKLTQLNHLLGRIGVVCVLQGMCQVYEIDELPVPRLQAKIAVVIHVASRNRSQARRLPVHTDGFLGQFVLAVPDWRPILVLGVLGLVCRFVLGYT